MNREHSTATTNDTRCVKCGNPIAIGDQVTVTIDGAQHRYIRECDRAQRDDDFRVRGDGLDIYRQGLGDDLSWTGGR